MRFRRTAVPCRFDTATPRRTDGPLAGLARPINTSRWSPDRRPWRNSRESSFGRLIRNFPPVSCFISVEFARFCSTSVFKAFRQNPRHPQPGVRGRLGGHCIARAPAELKIGQFFSAERPIMKMTNKYLYLEFQRRCATFQAEVRDPMGVHGALPLIEQGFCIGKENMRTRTQQIISLAMIGVVLGGCNQFDAYFQPKDSAEEYVSKATLLIQKGDLAAAIEELDKAISADPTYAPALAAKGDIYRQKGDYKLACVNYEEACDADQYAFGPHYNLAVMYQKLADLSPTLREKHDLLNEAILVHLRALAIKPGSFDAYLNLGACYFQLGKPDLAEQNTRQALRINPRSPSANNNLGTICESKGDYDQAIQVYKASIEADPRQGDILLNLGSLYMQNEHPHSALYTFRTAAKLSPQDAVPWRRMGVCLFRMKKLDEAVRAFQQAIRLDPSNPVAYRGIGVICMYQYIIDPGRTDLRDKALQAWRFSLELKGDQEDLARLIDHYNNGELEETFVAEMTPTPPPASTPPDVKRPAVRLAPAGSLPVWGRRTEPAMTPEPSAGSAKSTPATRPPAARPAENTVEIRPAQAPVESKPITRAPIKPIEKTHVSPPKPTETTPAPAVKPTETTLAPPPKPTETTPAPAAKATETTLAPAPKPITTSRQTFKRWTEPPRLSTLVAANSMENL